jgi:chromate reductase, NAD(P)H dehydrogenase (quinone)
MAATIEILAILGSLRKGSYNRAALRAAHELLPSDTLMVDFTLEDIPPYNQDEEAHLPLRVAELKVAIHTADAILIVTPEYNYSIPGVLKNAIDWSSRRGADNLLVWEGKPVGMMGASMGAQGTARAQYHLRQVLVFLDAHPLNKPEVMISGAAQKFDAEGNLTDDKTREGIRKLLEALVRWTRQLQPGRAAE